MALRPLHPYESFLESSSMGLALTLTGSINEKSLQSAFELTRKEHPVLCVVVEADEHGGMWFKESLSPRMYLTVEDPVDLDEDDAHCKLTDWVNQKRDSRESLFYFQYLPPSSPGRNHVLLVAANHSAMDGPGENRTKRNYSHCNQ